MKELFSAIGLIIGGITLLIGGTSIGGPVGLLIALFLLNSYKKKMSSS